MYYAVFALTPVAGAAIFTDYVSCTGISWRKPSSDGIFFQIVESHIIIRKAYHGNILVEMARAGETVPAMREELEKLEKERAARDDVERRNQRERDDLDRTKSSSDLEIVRLRENRQVSLD